MRNKERVRERERERASEPSMNVSIKIAKGTRGKERERERKKKKDAVTSIRHEVKSNVESNSKISLLPTSFFFFFCFSRVYK